MKHYVITGSLTGPPPECDQTNKFVNKQNIPVDGEWEHTFTDYVKPSFEYIYSNILAF